MIFEWYVHRTGEGVFPEISGSSPPFREIAPPQTILPPCVFMQGASPIATAKEFV